MKNYISHRWFIVDVLMTQVRDLPTLWRLRGVSKELREMIDTYLPDYLCGMRLVQNVNAVGSHCSGFFWMEYSPHSIHYDFFPNCHIFKDQVQFNGGKSLPLGVKTKEYIWKLLVAIDDKGKLFIAE